MKRQQGQATIYLMLAAGAAALIMFGTIVAQAKAIGGARVAAEAVEKIHQGDIHRLNEANKGWQAQLAVMQMEAERDRQDRLALDRELRAVQHKLDDERRARRAADQIPECAAVSRLRLCPQLFDLVRKPVDSRSGSGSAAAGSDEVPGSGSDGGR